MQPLYHPSRRDRFAPSLSFYKITLTRLPAYLKKYLNFATAMQTLILLPENL
jgi:hypothetical protein